MDKFAITIGLSILALAVVVVAMQYIWIKEQEVKNEARFACAQSSRYQTTDKSTGATVWYPVQDLYEKCLREKGL